jgi:hypothetical protein
VCLVVLAVLLLVASRFVPFARAGMSASKAESTPATKVESSSVTKARLPEPTYKIAVGLNGEVFPVFANAGSFQDPSEREWPAVAVTVVNSSGQELRQRIAVRLPGWSDEEIQLAEVGPGQVKTYKFAPTFYGKLYRNDEITAATTSVTITDMSGKVVYSRTAPVRLRSADDMFWGEDFKYAPYIASWVTPHDPEVERVLSIAKEYMPGRRLPGYESWKSADEQSRMTYAEARAIYTALRRTGISYVKSSATLGTHMHAQITERVRMPGESLRLRSANCIDGAVMYASLFENLGMDPVVVLVPGHAYVGVRSAEQSDRYLYIETALTGRANFDAAVNAASRGLARFRPGEITMLRINEARQAGIYPMPEGRRPMPATLENTQATQPK